MGPTLDGGHPAPPSIAQVMVVTVLWVSGVVQGSSTV